MEPSVEELKENYKRLSDVQLIKLATQEAGDLRPEAIAIMRDEIIARGLSTNLLNGIAAQLTSLEEEEILYYCEVIRNNDCPICGESRYKLNATIKAETIGLIYMSDYTEQLIIACPDCLYKANQSAMIKTALLGWWDFPRGIIHTIKALRLNSKLIGQTKVQSANKTLRRFVIKNVGIIETNKDDAERMKLFVKYLK